MQESDNDSESIHFVGEWKPPVELDLGKEVYGVGIQISNGEFLHFVFNAESEPEALTKAIQEVRKIGLNPIMSIVPPIEVYKIEALDGTK